MTTENKPKRATRRIKKFDFSSPDATVSLVGDAVGGAANSYVTLVTKSNKKVSEEFLQKASQITVTMSINEYLEKFFGIWCSTDQELLARSLGFTTEGMDKAVIEQQEEILDSTEPPEKPDYWETEPGDKSFEDYINYKLQSISIMKSLFESENIEKDILALSEEDYLKVLQDQAVVEKAFADIDKACGKGKGTRPVKKNSSANAEDTSTPNGAVEIKSEVNTSVVKQSNKEKSMTKEVQTIEQSVEVIEKAQFDALQKSLEDNQVQLQKALEEIEAFKAEKKEAIAKARKQQLQDAVGDKAEVFMKALGESADEVFADVVKALGEMKTQLEKSDLFRETGASVAAQEDANETPIAKALKARLSKKQ